MLDAVNRKIITKERIYAQYGWPNRGLVLLIILTLRGMNLFIAAPLCALLVALSGNMALFPSSGVELGFCQHLHGWLRRVFKRLVFHVLTGLVIR